MRKFTQRDKAKIRKSKEWNQLRIDVAAKFNNRDAITGEPLRKMWNLHHMDLDEAHYDDFTMENDFGMDRFIPLNHTTHELLHSLYRSATRKKNPRNMEQFFENLLKRIKEMSALNK